MGRPRSLEKLALRICAAVKEATAGRSMQWVLVDAVQKALDEDGDEIVQAAITCGKDHYWLSVGGYPAHSLSITSSGMAALVKAKKR